MEESPVVRRNVWVLARISSDTTAYARIGRIQTRWLRARMEATMLQRTLALSLTLALFQLFLLCPNEAARAQKTPRQGGIQFDRSGTPDGAVSAIKPIASGRACWSARRPARMQN